jgi:outer membrane receptor for ferrienterochelin and colicin
MMMLFVVAPAVAGPQASPAPDAEDALALADLGDIEVYSASKRRQSIEDAPASVTVVTAAEIDAFRYRTLSDVLRSVPGFFVTNDRNYEYVAVRGFGRPGDYNTRILLLIDGARVNDAMWDMAAVDRELPVDMALVERIEVVRGPGSALYGANAFFAVVNMITRSGRQVGGIQADAGVAGLGLRSGGLTWGGAIRGTDVLVSASGVTKTGDRRLYFEEFADSPSGGMAHDADGEKTRRLFASVSRSGFDLTFAHTARGKTVPTGAYEAIFDDPRNVTDDVRTHASLTYEGGRAAVLAARLSYERYDFDADLAYEDGLYREDATVDSVAGETSVTRPLGAHHVLTAGMEAQMDLRRGNRITETTGGGFEFGTPGWRSGAFLQDEWQLGRGFTAHLGGRYDRYSDAGATVSPRAGLVWRGNAVSVKALIGEAFRPPNEYERNYYPATARSLGPETIRTAELVLEARPWDRVRLGGSVFHNDVRNLIEVGAAEGGGQLYDQFLFRNAGRAVTHGFELQAQVANLAGFAGRTSYTFQRSEDQLTGLDLTNSPRHLATLTLTRPFARDRGQASVEMRGMSSRLAFDRLPVPGHFITNVHLTARLNRKIEAVASVYDAFGRGYADPGGEGHRQHAIVQEGRALGLQIRFRLGE